MTKKRFECRLNKEIKKFHALNPVWDNKLKTALNVFEMIDKLNELNQLNYNFAENAKEYQKIAKVEYEHNRQLEKENKKLQERNNRQCKQLDDLCRLIEEKDWKGLTDIMDDFKKADEQLQKEWGTYLDEF